MIKNEKGFSLLEVLVAIVLIGIIAAGVLYALATASKVLFMADERTTAESLARAQMEYIKDQPYCDGEWSYEVTFSSPPVLHGALCWEPLLLSKDYAGYWVKASAENFEDNREGIRKITVVVYHPYDAEHPEKTKMLVELEAYKGER